MVAYFDQEIDYDVILAVVVYFVAKTNSEPCPDYREEIGFKEYQGVCDQIRMRYYPRIFDKASFLFVSIASKQMFSNGNKRLAVSSLAYFMDINGYDPDKKTFSSQNLWQELEKMVGRELEDKTPHLFFYSLALMVADPKFLGSASFQTKKDTVKSILKLCFKKS